MQRGDRPYHVVLACFLGWTIDAFDFFILTFVLTDIAREFDTSVTTISWALTLTLALRAVGALLFGRLADRYGRKPALIANVLIFSALEMASGFSPTLTVFLILRALFGVAMGGEWGIGASLAMESIPAAWRGLVSGILQSGYSVGNLLAALLYGIGFSTLGWRGMFIVAAAPALVVLYVRRSVPESPAWERQERAGVLQGTGLAQSMRKNWAIYVYAIILMSAAATFSHGTQDLYPTFLREQHGLTVHEVSIVLVISNIGAILGNLVGGGLSQVLGRRRQMILAVSLVVALLPFWANAAGVTALVATHFVMQFLVQCTFGVMPAHLNEISPPEARATFPGFSYQLGNTIAAGNATIQAALAVWLGHNYGTGLAIVVGIGAFAFVALAIFGREAMDTDMHAVVSPVRVAPGGELEMGRRASHRWAPDEPHA
jgi:SHS family lactate transporter-like MFS transporter